MFNQQNDFEELGLKVQRAQHRLEKDRGPSSSAVVFLSIVFTIIASLVAGCSSGKSDEDGARAVDESLTEVIARERINTYLMNTLQALPPGVSLSRTPDNPNLGTLGEESAITVPCDDDNTHSDGPEQAQIGYWIVGVPSGQQARYIGLIRDIWTGQGFRVNPDSDPDWFAVLTPDKYRLVLQGEAEVSGGLSITAASPCFPKSGLGTTEPQPTELKRPN